jgi:hypothetical protein
MNIINNEWTIAIFGGVVVGLILHYGFGVGKDRKEESNLSNAVRKGIVLNGQSKAKIKNAKIKNQTISIEINDKSKVDGRGIKIS